MNKQEWLFTQIKKFPKLSARELTAKLNDKKLVDNPEPQQQVAVLPSLAEVLAVVTPQEAFKISETRTYDRILEAFNQRNISNIIINLGILKSGDILSDSSYTKLINLLQRLQLDPSYQPKVLMSEAELLGFDLVLVNEIDELL